MNGAGSRRRGGDVARTSDRRPLERFDLDGGGIGLTREAVWAGLERCGFSKSETAAERFEALYNLGSSLIEPQALGQLFPISALAKEEKSALPAPIRRAEYLCFCVSTAGRPIDERARALCADGELVDSMILDAIAMAGLSLVGDRLGQMIFGWAAKRGLAASRSFSPGAGASHWSLEYQGFLFHHLPERPLGVELTDRFLMKPSKSVSFVIGIGSEVKQAAHPFSCEGCERLDCAYRHLPEGEMVHPEYA